MSYDLYLCDPVQPRLPAEEEGWDGGAPNVLLLDAPHQMKGGTYALGGTREAHLNVTYNYGKHYRRVLDAEEGIRAIYGLTGAESIPVLRAAAAQLGDDVDEDYWKPTEGNAKRALLQLLALAQLRPDGIWQGD